MASKKRTRAKAPRSIVAALKPLIPAVVKPVVKPVMQRLDRHEELLLALKASLDVQFQRIASIQAQLDALITVSRRA
jgi:hypothetical protein